MEKPVVNPFEAAAAALKSGADIEQAVYGKPGSTPVENNAVQPGEPKPEVQIMDGSEPETLSVDSFRTEEERTPSPVAAKAKPAAEKANSPEAERSKQFEKGMRKFQTERDQAVKELSAVKPELKALKDNWAALEGAFSSDGIAGVINLLAGKPDAYKAHIQSELDRANARASATPSQKAQMDYEDRIQAEQRARAKLEKEFKELNSTVAAKAEAAELSQVKSIVNPIYEKYRFTGKLGDAEAEYYQDKALWREAMENLDALPEEQITRETIEAEFKKAADNARRVINRQADSKVKKTLEAKKVSAQDSAATRAMSGMQSSAATDDFRANIRSGNIADAFRALTTGKIRLS